MHNNKLIYYSICLTFAKVSTKCIYISTHVCVLNRCRPVALQFRNIMQMTSSVIVRIDIILSSCIEYRKYYHYHYVSMSISLSFRFVSHRQTKTMKHRIWHCRIRPSACPPNVHSFRTVYYFNYYYHCYHYILWIYYGM